MKGDPPFFIAISSIKKAIGTCDAALDLLSQSSQVEDVPPPELAVIRQDFLSLLLLIYGSTTKLSLAMKPKAPTYSAALSPLKDISDHISALAHCTNMLLPEIHGATLVQEFNNVCIDVTKSAKSLLAIFDAPETRDLESGDEYLVKTGEIHHLIDKARSSSGGGLSVDNLSAVRKKWLEDSGPLDDGLKELNDMIEYGGEDAEDNKDDEWDELGLGSVKCADEKELERTKQVTLSIIVLYTLTEKTSRFTPSSVYQHCYTNEFCEIFYRHHRRLPFQYQISTNLRHVHQPCCRPRTTLSLPFIPPKIRLQ